MSSWIYYTGDLLSRDPFSKPFSPPILSPCRTFCIHIPYDCMTLIFALHLSYARNDMACSKRKVEVRSASMSTAYYSCEYGITAKNVGGVSHTWWPLFADYLCGFGLMPNRRDSIWPVGSPCWRGHARYFIPYYEHYVNRLYQIRGIILSLYAQAWL